MSKIQNHFNGLLNANIRWLANNGKVKIDDGSKENPSNSNYRSNSIHRLR
jgi:hypothetical protein